MAVFFNGMMLDFGGGAVKFEKKFEEYSITVKERTSLKNLYCEDITNTALNDGDRLIYLIRHSERGDTDLTTDGIWYAKRAGEQLKTQLDSHSATLTADDCAFFGTSTKRTTDTANYFRQGLLGLDTVEEVAVADNGFRLNFDPTGGDFDNYNWVSLASYCKSDNDGAIDKVATQIAEYCLKISTDKKFTLCVTHDFNLMPLFAWAGRYSSVCTFDFQEGSTDPWICYLTGVAMVVHDDTKNIEIKPFYCIQEWHSTELEKTIGLQSGDSGYAGRLLQGYTDTINQPSHD